jgi:ABC-type antimicrobial peptide transport system permease subunit
VRARWNEFGIRIALGARPATVMRSVLREGLMVTSIGLLLGLAGSYVATQSLAGLLFGVTPHDILTYASTAAAFALTAALACYFPARRATEVDPVVSLRSE